MKNLESDRICILNFHAWQVMEFYVRVVESVDNYWLVFIALATANLKAVSDEGRKVKVVT